jgi:hypothetical protein
MAYVGDTARLCQAIVDGDLEHVQDWCSQEGVDVSVIQPFRLDLSNVFTFSTLKLISSFLGQSSRLHRPYSATSRCHGLYPRDCSVLD